MKLVVRAVTPLTAEIRHFELAAPDGAALPAYTPGAHLSVHVVLPDGTPARREYSLLGDGSATASYDIAVQCREPAAGSAWMHRLAVGDRIEAEPPVNAFALAADAAEHVLIAGGIGITPILSMARHLRGAGAAFTLHYAGRARAAMAFAEEAAAMGAACRLYHDDGAPLQDALPGILAAPAAGRHLYVCGPRALIADTVDGAAAAGWPSASVHYELFQGALALRGDQPFDLVLRQSGITVSVPAGQTMLDALLQAGVEPLYDCRRGECGMCLTPVLQGKPDHRDHYLSPREREAGDAVCVCVSRACGASLTLDL
ncbi:PDR/VanB family oxidoreductase [Bordetella bronchiseptica]|uniref:PDR/VanB family oxidoreductase n=1 Tax=Bordetella bronchiseptica TaxID=518 RepID=UPI000460D37D|nr:PDR/VanB family oxidoreductase [Bordetella bronchiseptica]KDD12897.1 2Fe-2S iron-sulfur cluster-binding domain protein [Bordetella bronchiseptica MBORD707]